MAADIRETGKRRLFISFLNSHPGVIDRPTVNPRRSAGFQPFAGIDNRRRHSAKATEGGSPARPAGIGADRCRMSPLRNVPVVRTTALAPSVLIMKACVTPVALSLLPLFQQPRLVSSEDWARLPALVSFPADSDPGPIEFWDSEPPDPAACSAVGTGQPVGRRSGPAVRPLRQSRTRCPLAIPPMAGLHDMDATRLRLGEIKAVQAPRRAAAWAASAGMTGPDYDHIENARLNRHASPPIISFWQREQAPGTDHRSSQR